MSVWLRPCEPEETGTKMTERRYFRVWNQEQIARLEAYRSRRTELQAARERFLDAWGSRHVVRENDTNNIVALKDPRTFDPPQALPKGWRKSKSYGGVHFVAPNNATTTKSLRDLDYGRPQEAIFTIIRHLASLCPENHARIQNIGQKVSPNTCRWFFDMPNGDHFMAGPKFVYFEPEGVWCVSIPDPMLQYRSLYGYDELRRWEWEKLIDEHNAYVQGS